MPQLRRPARDQQDLTFVARLRARLAIGLTLLLGALLAVGCGLPVAPGPSYAPGVHVEVQVQAAPTATAVLPPSPAPQASPSPAPTAPPTPTLAPTPGLAERLREVPMPVRVATLPDEALSQPPAVLHQVGDRKSFWVLDLEVAGHVSITATLRAAGEYVQIWVQDGVPVAQDALEEAARAFDERIYPTVRAAFGSERTPGIDGDPRLVVLNARLSGASGYFAANNSYPRSVDPYSNEHEMFVMNLNALQPGSDLYLRVLAHEFQHMIHWRQNPGEAAWINEGASLLAEDLAGYGPPQADVNAYARQPGLQLTTWSARGDRISAHYGAAYLLLRYFYERYGADALRALVAHPRRGIPGLDDVLATLDGRRFDDLLADWAIANLLDDPTLEDGRYGYAGVSVAAEPQAVAHRYPHTTTATLNPYGVQYVTLYPPLDAQGPETLHIRFEGPTTTRLVPADAPDGGSFWWSNRGDLGHSLLERRLDLTGVASAELTYDLWFDLEYGWDYAGVRVSEDGGESWTWLVGEQMAELPGASAAPGPVYSGRSGVSREALYSLDPPPARWVQERLDLTPYAGREILLRFDTYTDDSVNEPGLCLDNLRVEAIGFHDDAETDDAGWRAEGFLRVDNTLPVAYIAQVVTYGEGVGVQRLPVEQGVGEWLLPGLGGGVERAVLALAAVAPVTTEPIPYTLLVEVWQGP